jgi:hypothetical protein
LAASVRYPERMRRKLANLQLGHSRALLDDIVDCLRIQCAAGNIASAINRTKHAAVFNFVAASQALSAPTGACRSDKRPHPGWRQYSWCGQDGWRARGGGLRCHLPLGARLSAALFANRQLRCAYGPGGEGDHQDRAIPQIAQAVVAAGRVQLGQHPASDRLGTLGTALPRHSADGKADCRLDGRGGESAVEAAPVRQC